MNECTTIGRSEKSSALISATEDEIYVAEILLDLPNIIRENESCLGFKWGCKNRRSRLYEGRAPSSLSPSFRKIEERKSKAKTAEMEEAAAESPITPLSFAPSESNEKNSRHAFKRSCRIRSREEYLDLIEELTQRRDLLRGEIKNVTKYYNKLNAYNSEINAMKQEVLNSCLRKKEPEMEINLGMELTQNHYHQSSVDPMAEKFQHALGPATAQLYSSYNGLGSVNAVGPFGILDLNIGFDPSQPLGASNAFADRRARFAEARRMRKGIIKIKSMRRACGIKLPGTR